MPNNSIDLIYCWVDGNDPDIKKKKRKKLQECQIDGRHKFHKKEFNNKTRDRDNQELKYSLRSVEKYMPWINHIYIVTDGQTPEWLKLNSHVSIVDHREIIPSKYLPTFNSLVIESHLHMIPNLSERFIYSNDDLLLFQPVYPHYFFNGYLPIYRFQMKPTTTQCELLGNTDKYIFSDGMGELEIPERSQKVINNWIDKCHDLRLYSWKGTPTTEEVGHISQWKNANSLLDNKFTCDKRFQLFHCFRPFTIRQCLEAQRLFRDEIQLSNNFPFRSIRSIGTVNALYPYMSLYQNQALVATNSDDRFTVYMKDDIYLNYIQMVYLVNTRPIFICLQDGYSDDKITASYLEYLEIFYPKKSCWENK